MTISSPQNREIGPMHIAPCGLDCRLCRAYIRDRNPCPGCRGGDNNKSDTCLACAIKNCSEFKEGKQQFCYSCARFPCDDLLHLDRRYRLKYGVSPISNLGRIKIGGLESFIIEEISKWSCAQCGSLLCMHKPQCVNCGHELQSRQ